MSRRSSEILPVLGSIFEDLNLDGIAELQHILDRADAAVGHTGDVQKAVLAGGELDEGAEVLDADDLALENLTDLGLFHDAEDRWPSQLRRPGPR